MDRIELHTNSIWSKELALSDPTQIVSMCAKYGCKAVAITDRNSVQGYMDAEQEAVQKGVTLIYGLTVDCLDADDRYAVTLLAKNEQGREQIFDLIKQLHRKEPALGLYVTREELDAHREGLLFGASAVDGQLVRAIQLQKSERTLQAAAQTYDYIELPLEPYDVSAKLCQLGHNCGIPLCAVQCSSLYNGRDEVFRHIYQALALHEGISANATMYLSGEELEQEFRELYILPSQKEAIEEALHHGPEQIFSQIQPMPTLEQWVHEGSEEMHREAMQKLETSAWRRFAERYGDSPEPRRKKRLEFELQKIDEAQVAADMMVLEEMAAALSAENSPISFEGNWGSFFLLFLLGVVEHDPMSPDFELPVEPFLLTKNKLHGINLQTSINSKSIILKHLKNRYGARLLALTPPANVRRSKEDTAQIEEEYLASMDKEQQMQLKNNPVFAHGIAWRKDPDIRCFLYRLIILPDPKKRDLLPTFLPGDFDIPVWCAWSWNCSLPTFTIINRNSMIVLEDCQQSTGVAWNDIPLDEERVYSAICSMDIPGMKDIFSMFAFPSEGKNEGMRSLLPIRDLRSLSRVMSLSHGRGVWIGSQEELLQSGTICPEQAICCREDVYRYLISRGADEQEAASLMESVRSCDVKRRGFTDEETALLQRCKAEEWFQAVCQKTEYLFPEAHSVTPSRIFVRLVWYLLHFPELVRPILSEAVAPFKELPNC